MSRLRALIRDYRIPLLVTAGVLAALAACTAITQAAPDPENELPVLCHALIKERLKAPAGADFTGTEVTGTGPAYTVRGWVDSENSFGANVRSEYGCDATWDEDAGVATGLTVTRLEQQ